jgi:2-phosphosulfolactate phosphatase
VTAIGSGPSGIDVALARHQVAAADTLAVVDCIRATTVIAHALAAGYARVHCVEEIDAARAVAAAGGDGHVLGGERGGHRIDGFHLGNSPGEYAHPLGTDLVFSTTNGTRAIVAAAAHGREVLCAAMVNLEAICRRLAATGGRMLVVCAGVEGRPALDDTYVAGRIVGRVRQLAPDARPTDAALIAQRVAESFDGPQDALSASSSARNLADAALESDVADCARESILAVVPVVAGVRDGVVRVQALGDRAPAGRTQVR